MFSSPVEKPRSETNKGIMSKSQKTNCKKLTADKLKKFFDSTGRPHKTAFLNLLGSTDWYKRKYCSPAPDQAV